MDYKFIVVFVTVYLHNVVTMNLCNINPALKFNLNKEGFHRELDIYMKFTADQDNVWNDFQVVFEQTIPSGSYVNPDELEELRRMNKFMACSGELINVESPEHESTPHTVYVYADLVRDSNVCTAAAKLPVHVRYHSANAGGIPATVVFQPPILLLKSNSSVECGQRRKAPCGPCYQDLCEFSNVPYKSESKPILISVPVGNLNHANFVMIVTLIITIASAVYVCKVIVDSVKAAALRKMK